MTDTPKCEWEYSEICCNDECPLCCDYCPVADVPGVCKWEDREAGSK